MPAIEAAVLVDDNIFGAAAGSEVAPAIGEGGVAECMPPCAAMGCCEGDIREPTVLFIVV